MPTGVMILYQMQILSQTNQTRTFHVKTKYEYRYLELSPLDTLSICLDTSTVIDRTRGIGQLYKTTGYRIWPETAERNFGLLTIC